MLQQLIVDHQHSIDFKKQGIYNNLMSTWFAHKRRFCLAKSANRYKENPQHYYQLNMLHMFSSNSYHFKYFVCYRFCHQGWHGIPYHRVLRRFRFAFVATCCSLSLKNERIIKRLQTRHLAYGWCTVSMITNPLNYVDFLHARQSRSKLHFVLA